MPRTSYGFLGSGPEEEGSSEVNPAGDESPAGFRVEARGIEPLEESRGITASSDQGGAESGALDADSPRAAPPGAIEARQAADLARVVAAWSALPVAIRRAIVALVESVGR